MTAIEDLAAWIAGLSQDAIAAPLRDRLRLHVIDILGAWIAGAATAEGRMLIGLRAAAQSPSLADDLALHCALARLSEVDDIHLASMTTPGSIVIPAATVIAAALPESDDLAPAIVGGYEAMIRLGEAINGPQVLYRGIWPTYFGASFAGAAVAARLMRFDAKQTAHALALALTMAAPSVGQHHAPTTSRWLSVGHAARNGLMAAQATRAGFTSDINVLDSNLFSDVFGIALDRARLGADTEPRFTRLSFKPWCAARQTMAATQALRELIEGGMAVADVSAISAAVLPPHLKMIDHGVRAGDRASHLTSLPYQMAVAALRPDMQFDVGQAPAAIADDVQSLMARITVTGDDALLADYPAAWPARVSVTTTAGSREQLVPAVPGDPTRPLSESALLQKFNRLAVPVAGEVGARRILDAGSAVLQAKSQAISIVKGLDTICRAQVASRPA